MRGRGDARDRRSEANANTCVLRFKFNMVNPLTIGLLEATLYQASRHPASVAEFVFVATLRSPNLRLSVPVVAARNR